MKWTEDDYLRMESHSPIKHEFLDGEIYAMAGAKSRHNVIATNVLIALGILIRRRGGDCRVFNSDQRIRVQDPKKFYTYADGGVGCGQWLISNKDGMSLENPGLLFEVLSRSTRDYDRGTKLLLYRQIPSLMDILLVDQPTRLVEYHHRGPRGWKVVGRTRGGLTMLGGVIHLEELYDVPPGVPEDE